VGLRSNWQNTVHTASLPACLPACSETAYSPEWLVQAWETRHICSVNKHWYEEWKAGGWLFTLGNIFSRHSVATWVLLMPLQIISRADFNRNTCTVSSDTSYVCTHCPLLSLHLDPYVKTIFPRAGLDSSAWSVCNEAEFIWPRP